MPELLIVKFHTLGVEEAKRRADSSLAAIAASDRVDKATWTWDGNVATVKCVMHGHPWEGTLTVFETSVEVKAALPLLFYPFMGTIEKELGDSIEQSLQSFSEREVTMSWKKGPLPERTFNWGGVVPFDLKSQGFFFADFMGDHVVLCPSGRVLKAHEVAYYNNSLELPPAPAGSSGEAKRLN